MKGVKGNTARVFNALMDMEFLDEYILIGGTALSLQIHHRYSEDLDFCKWQNDPKLRTREIEWPEIEKKLRELGTLKTDILDLYQVNFLLNGVKVSFYSNALTTFREVMTDRRYGHIRLADIPSLGAMKLEVMSRRYLFRDYYDVYSILQEGIRLKDLVTRCGRYSRHRMRSKMILGILSNGALFAQEEDFALLKPKYHVTSGKIEEFMRHRIRDEFSL